MNIKYDHQQRMLCNYDDTKYGECRPVTDDQNLQNMIVIL